MARSVHYLVADAERIHDIEGKQGNVRGLEHIAAGVKHEVRRLDGRGNRRRFLAKSFEHFRIELQARKHRRSATSVAVPLYALSASFGKLIVRLRDAKPRHGEQETRIDAVVACLDAFPALHAGLRPFARCFRTVAGAHQLEDAPTMSSDFISEMPAGSTLGQTSTHLPHWCRRRACPRHVRPEPSRMGSRSSAELPAPACWRIRHVRHTASGKKIV